MHQSASQPDAGQAQGKALNKAAAKARTAALEDERIDDIESIDPPPPPPPPPPPRD